MSTSLVTKPEQRGCLLARAFNDHTRGGRR